MIQAVIKKKNSTLACHVSVLFSLLFACFCQFPSCYSVFRLNWRYLKPCIKLNLHKLAFLINPIFVFKCTVDL